MDVLAIIQILKGMLAELEAGLQIEYRASRVG